MTENLQYTLTPSEAAMIEKRRAEEAAVDRRERLVAHLLDTARSFAEWLHINGRGPTFSTFCDEYATEMDYELPDGIKMSAVYAAICAVIENALAFAATASEVGQ